MTGAGEDLGHVCVRVSGNRSVSRERALWRLAGARAGAVWPFLLDSCSD